ncbi:MAG: PQQ-dependent sugar dehydrogenase [Myxococcota bacterium]|nr:PQQ-dependent sugar dehydrogenase [Myxococcota bacterium]
MSARKVTLVLIAVIGLVGLSMFNPTVKNWGRATLLSMFEPSYQPALAQTAAFRPVFDELDAKREKIDVKLTVAADGFIQITDLQFVPGQPDLLVVLEKSGKAKWVDLKTKKTGLWFDRKVLFASEQGLLGLAFDPQFASNGRFFINETIRDNGKDWTQVAALQNRPTMKRVLGEVDELNTVIRVQQPYANHNAGQLAFGPDGMLYVGLGDGGWADDPHNHGQNPKSLLGKMLRLDVSKVSKQKGGYVVPKDNPFVGRSEFLPEIWALGLRNPWKYSFTPQGRLLVADVGQNAYEEISVISSGDNGGWKTKEGFHCFSPKSNCSSDDLVDPIYEYGRADGGSITGGFVVSSKTGGALTDKYVFGDFLSGRLWALALPSKVGQKAKAFALGRYPILPSTFAKDSQGNVYVGAFRDGVVYKINPKNPG